MSKFNEFSNKKEEYKNFEKLFGLYGCQSCPEDLSEAWFDDRDRVIFWICSEGHRSEIKVGV